MPEIESHSWTGRLLAASVGFALSLGACSWAPVEPQRTERLGPVAQQQLNSSLKVASASANAGQLESAERLYTQLSRHFPGAPEPRLGLGYLALEAGDFTVADKFFAEARDRSATPAAKAEASVGAARVCLAQGDIVGAKAHFLAASGAAKGTPAEAWVANGLGVVATLEGDHARARTHYEEAVALSSSHPMITANLVRAVAVSGAVEEAERLYASYPASHWLDGDGAALATLLLEQRAAAALARSEAAADAAQSAAKAGSVEQGAMAGSVQSGAAAGSAQQGKAAASMRPGAAEDPLQPPAVASPAEPGGATTPAAGVEASQATGSAHADAGDGVAGRPAGAEAQQDSANSGAGAPSGAATPAAGAPPQEAAQTVAAEAGGDAAGSASRAEAQQAVRAARSEGGGDAAVPGSGATVQIYSGRSRDRALAAWRLLSSAEGDLLGSLTSRVVRADIRERGVFFRLWAGPLADKAAARRLCGTLKRRGRDCFVRAEQWTGGERTGGVRPSGAGQAMGSRDLPGSAGQGTVDEDQAGDANRGTSGGNRFGSEEQRMGGEDRAGSMVRGTGGEGRPEGASQGTDAENRPGAVEQWTGADDRPGGAGPWAGGENRLGGAEQGTGGEDRPGGAEAETGADAQVGGASTDGEAMDAQFARARVAERARQRAAGKEDPAARDGAAAPAGAYVQLYAGRSRNGVLTAWGRLLSTERELLGSLTARVVRAEIPQRGVFFRLWVGPLADKAAAGHLCGLLKGRKHDCLVRVAN